MSGVVWERARRNGDTVQIRQIRNPVCAYTGFTVGTATKVSSLDSVKHPNTQSLYSVFPQPLLQTKLLVCVPKEFVLAELSQAPGEEIA